MRAARTYKVTDDGTSSRYSVSLHAKDKVSITFSECTSCGYSWSVSAAPRSAVARSAGDSSRPAAQPASGPPMVGGSGTHTFTFQAVGAGKTTVSFGYFPPGSRPADRTVVLTITVS